MYMIKRIGQRGSIAMQVNEFTSKLDDRTKLIQVNILLY